MVGALHQFRLHLLERLDKLGQIFHIKHDGGFLSSAGLLRHLEELSVAGLFEVDIKRALACMDSHRVDILRVTAAVVAAGAGRTIATGIAATCGWGAACKRIMALGACR